MNNPPNTTATDTTTTPGSGFPMNDEDFAELAEKLTIQYLENAEEV